MTSPGINTNRPPVEVPASNSHSDADHDRTESPYGSVNREQAEQPRKPVTIASIQRLVKQGETFAALTAYDAITARWLDRAGVPVLLAGDSAAEVILGFDSTVHAPLEFMLAITAAVKRGAPNTLVMADMPFLSYQADDAEAVRNAGRFLTEANADIVKLEVDGRFTELFEKLSRAGIPACAHIGLKPQQRKLLGGYRVSGKTAETARQLVADAVRFQEAGAVMLLLEATPAEVSQRIVEATSIPVIGCGAGPACHGQIVVLQDLLGLTDRQPAFASPIASMGEDIRSTAVQWIDMVRRRDLGEHPYHMPDVERGKF